MESDEDHRPEVKKKIRKDKQRHVEKQEYVEEPPKKSKPQPKQEQQEQAMPKKKNLQIEVIEHPDADVEAENVESGDGSEYEATDPNQYSEQNEPNYREGTENEGHYDQDEQYSDSMEGNTGQPKQSLQSFGNKSGHVESEGEEEEEEQEHHKIRQNAKNAKNGISGIGEHHLNDFVKKKKDPLNKTTKLTKNAPAEEEAVSDEGEQDLEYTEEDNEYAEDKIDDELVLRQQREAEQLLEETKKTIYEDEQQQVSQEDEEDEVEEIAKMAEENRVNEGDPEEEEEEDELENATMNNGKKFELNYTVGRIEDGAAILISKDHNLIEIPLWLLPSDIGPGNILRFSVDRNTKAEEKRVNEILSIQKQILENPNFFEE